MTQDISRLLDEWPYDPQKNARLVKAADGREVLQVRQPLGLEQYELDGRPDGERPEGRVSCLDLYKERLGRRAAAGEGAGRPRLTDEEADRLYEEAVLYYQRYVILFQIGDYERTVRDTSRNLEVCDLAEEYVENEEKRLRLCQYRPYIIRLQALARAMDQFNRGAPKKALGILDEALLRIEALEEIPTLAFQLERTRSLTQIKAFCRQLKEKPATIVDRLEAELADAVRREKFEDAARIRDRLRTIRPE